MNKEVKTFVQLEMDPASFFKTFDEKLNRMEKLLNKDLSITPSDFISPDQFCQRTNISRWQFDMYKNCGQLNYKKIGRKVYVSIKEVDRYFDGKMNLP